MQCSQEMQFNQKKFDTIPLWVFLRALQKSKFFLHSYNELTQFLIEKRGAIVTSDDLWRALLVSNFKEVFVENQKHIGEIVNQELEKLIRLNPKIQFCHLLDQNYPHNLLKTLAPPWTFQFVGSSCWNDHFILGIVGSREPTNLTLEWMSAEFKNFLQQTDKVEIMSGGARGVDQIAHSIALQCKKRTSAWIPSGLGLVYPSRFAEQVEEIIQQGGTLFSEFD